MKTHSPRPPAGTSLFSPARSDGMALVIVLAMLVLLSGLLVAFFSMALTERSAARAASGDIEVRQLADSTLHLVIAQIRDGTSVSDRGLGWASQPGAIRTFGPATEAGANRIFKLYSAEPMVQDSSSYDPAQDSYWPGADLKLRFGFTDLNDPSLAADGTYVFPVINPKAKYNLSGKAADPREALVEGFRCADLADPVRRDEFHQPLPLLPLAVKWLYLLKDGSLGTLEALAAHPDSRKHPGRHNPVVGRTAFWTDDESGKININTASEPAYWGTPLTTTAHELGLTISSDGYTLDPAFSERSLNLAVAQPVQGEFQRYPGHPATTSLSPVFRRLFDLPLTHSDKEYKEFIYQLAPRIYSDRAAGRNTSNHLSSAAGTRNRSPRPMSAAPGTLPGDLDRLYASPDELIFRAGRRNPDSGALLTHADANSYLPPAKGELITARMLDRVDFFLTATSRASELNQFGRPRVAIWPVAKEPTCQTGFDKAFAFTASLWPADPRTGMKLPAAQRGYYFQRQVADDSGQVDLIRSTDNGSRSMTKEWDGCPQNQRVYHYLQASLKTPPPGVERSLAEKFGDDRDQILTELWDYIRTTNLADATGLLPDGTLPTGAATPYTPRYAPKTNQTDPSRQPLEWSGQVVPLHIAENQSQGLGRFVTLTEAAIAFFVPDRRESAPAGTFTAPSAQGAPVMRAVLIFEFATPSAGYIGLRDTFSFTVTRLEKMAIEAGSAGITEDIFPTAPGTEIIGQNLVEVDALHGALDCAHTTGRGYTIPLLKWRNGVDPIHGSPSRAAKTFVVAGTPGVNRNLYPFLSREIVIDAAAQEFVLKGGRFRLDLYAGCSTIDSAKKVQSFEFAFAPKGRTLVLKKPRMIGQEPFEPDAPPFLGKRFEKNVLYNDRRVAAFFGNTYKVENPTPSDPDNIDIKSRTLDTVRSVELNGATRGDYRLSQAAGVTAALDCFEPRLGRTPTAEYYDPEKRVVHGLKHGGGDRGAGHAPRQTEGRFASGSQISARPPDLPVPAKAKEGVKRNDGGPGDWDRGPSWFPDGPLTNKPDEGNVAFGTGLSDSRLPYMSAEETVTLDNSQFSPNRLLASPVAFGSLPTGVKRFRPWETLLFRPDRAATGEPSHPGAAKDGFPADHYLLDLFWMPVVEPYAISEPSSTGGQINLNFGAAPFSYLQADGQRYWVRNTGLRAVLKGTKLIAVSKDTPLGGHSGNIVENGAPIRFDIDPDRTLEDFETRLFGPNQAKAFFRSASEICEMDLYPCGATRADGRPFPPGTDRFTSEAVGLPRTVREAGLGTSRAEWGAFWAAHSLTGDNGRELPYDHLYPRLTTKSNVFTVHLRAQAIQFPASYYAADAGGELNLAQLQRDYATEGDRATVLGEYRGSSTIERFLDPNDPALTQWVNDPAKSENPGNRSRQGSLDPYYRFRVLSTKRFAR